MGLAALVVKPLYSGFVANGLAGNDSEDVTAPVISNARVWDIQATTVDLSFTTDETNGTAYYVVTESATQPSIAQIKAGQNHLGAAAVANGSASVVSTTVTFNDVGPLTESTTYYGHFVHTDNASNDSNRLSTSSFVPTAAAAGRAMVKNKVLGIVRNMVKGIDG